MARSALTVAALVVAAIALATAQAKSIDFTEEDLASEDSMWVLYERWAAHNKVARDPAEKTKRFPIFKKNARFIHEFNQGDTRNKLGLNFFGDMTAEEITNYGTCFRYRPTPTDIPEHFGDMPAVAASDAPAIPVSVDWREKQVVTYVNKQGDCGACWAFAATGAVESIFAITNGSYVVLSEQMLVDCDNINNGCDGGTPWDAFDFIVKVGGIPSDFLYPYRGTEGTCDLDKISPSATLNGWSRLGRNNAPALMRAVAAQPVAVAIGIDFYFDWYTGGIYYGPGNTTLTHAVLVVGYGTNKHGENDWIVKNSWGTEWGDEGYIYISRDHGGEEGLCGILTAPSYPLLSVAQGFDMKPESGWLGVMKTLVHCSSCLLTAAIYIYQFCYCFLDIPVDSV